jgi:L-iditol 2-dehydrogenase
MRIAELVQIGKIAFRDAARPVPKPGEVLIRTRAVGLCGTDLKAYVRGHPYFAPPCVLGHEFAGSVAEVGGGVDAVNIGDAVVVLPYLECGVCASCCAGLGELCQHKAFVSGALQEYILLPPEIVRRGMFRLPEGVDFVTGSLAEPLACVINGIERSSIGPNHSILIVGGGPMGALLAMVARSRTPHVLVSEIVHARVEALASLGLNTVDPSRESVPDRLAEAFGVPKADRVLIAVGVRSVAEEAFAWTAPGGTGLLFGGLPKGDQLTVDPFAIHYQEVSLVGSFGFRRDHFLAAVAWLADHHDQAASLVTDTVAFEDIETGFALAQQAAGMKTVVVFGEGDGA